jgi:hypothetical protein
MPTEPIEVQRSRKKGYRQPSHTKYVGRGTVYGNPFKVSDKITPRTAVKLYKRYLKLQLKADPEFLEQLRGYNLSCFCPIGNHCHRQILLELANRPKATE